MMPPSTVQLLRGNDRFVVLKTLKFTLGVLVKANWNAPVESFTVSFRVKLTGVGVKAASTLR